MRALWIAALVAAIVLMNHINDADAQGKGWKWNSKTKKLYKYFSSEKKYADAKKECRKQGKGATLATVKSGAESKFIHNLRDKKKKLWLGLDDIKTEGKWRWNDGEALFWDNWSSNEPNNYKGKEDCAYMREKSQNWNDRNCNTKMTFVCMKHKQGAKPRKWKLNQRTEKLYSYFPGAKNYKDAVKTCRKFGKGKLATAKNKAELNFLNRLRNKKKDTWLGLDDIKVEGKWRWNDGSEITWDNWKKNEPNDYKGKEDCGYVLKNKDEWNDVKCSAKMPFICARNVPGTGARKWKLNKKNKKLYKYFVSKRTYSDADRSCRSLGGGATLATAKDASELKFIQKVRNKNKPIWLGLNDRKKEGKWKWSDGSALKWNKWSKNEPNDYKDGEDCASLLKKSDRWNDIDCDLTRNYVCMKPAPKSPKWKLNQKTDKQYKFFKNRKTYSDAKRACRKLGPKVRLATAKNKAELNFINSIRNKNKKVWLGLDDKKKEGKFKWSDGSALKWSNWRKNEPNNYGDGEDCAYLEQKSNRWNDVDCDNTMSYICMKPNNGCSKGFKKVGKFCIVAHNGARKNIEDAMDVCERKGGRLLQLGSLLGGFNKLAKFRGIKEKEYFIGGASSFLLKKNDADTKFIRKDFASKYKLRNNNYKKCLRRFAPNPSPQQLNIKSAVDSLCLVLDFKENRPKLKNCDAKLNFICEKKKSPPKNARWTRWISAQKASKNRSAESIQHIIKKFANTPQKKRKFTLCKNYLKMQCRDKKTKKRYTKASKKKDKRLKKSCEKGRIVCKGKNCPDFEVRFQCRYNPNRDCRVARTKRRCQKKGRSCFMGIYGARCVKKRRKRTGNEIFGSGVCRVNGRKHKYNTCYARGDPHYMTFDGRKFDFQGNCRYNFMSTCKDYKASNDYPSFKVTVGNYKFNIKDRVARTKEFIFEVNNIEYKVGQNRFWVDDKRRNLNGFRDANIVDVVVEAKGRNPKVKIVTPYCIHLIWDNKHFLQVQVPDHYKKHICGLCGNYDGKKNNDLKLGRRNVSPTDFGNFYYVAGSENPGCADPSIAPVKPTPPCSAKKKNQFKGNKFCGVYNPKKSALVKAVLRSSKGIATKANKELFQNLYEDCLFDYCETDKRGDSRCHYLETQIENLFEQLALDTSKLDRQWRKIAKCEKSDEKKCGGKKSKMVYKSSYLVNCQDSCADPDRSVLCEDLTTSSGCVCKQGYFLDNSLTRCVPFEKCKQTCTVELEDGIASIDDGENFVIEECKRVAKCRKGKVTYKERKPCSEHALCLKNKCRCNQGFKGDGYTCKPSRKCKNGYKSAGSKCYRFIGLKLDWHSAAILCGSEGAQLARYDTTLDEELSVFFKLVPRFYLLSRSKARKIVCRAKRSGCSLPKGEVGVKVRVADKKNLAKCKGKFKFSKNKRKLIVKGNCKAKFIVHSVKRSIKRKIAKKIATWVGGNLDVIGFGQGDNIPALQVTLPRNVDKANFKRASGCFQARRNKKGQMVLSTADCGNKKPSICEYDNTGLPAYDPLDFIPIKTKGTKQQIIEKCKAKGRPVVSLFNGRQFNAVKKILKRLRGDVYIGLEWNADASSFVWADGEPLRFRRFKGKPRVYKRNKELFCVSMKKGNGRWYNRRCSDKLFGICGPPESSVPKSFTPFYPVDGANSFRQFYNRLKNKGKADDMCTKPLLIECSAETKEGQWVSNFDQEGNTLTCKENRLNCKRGQEIKCNTFRVRFLCPADGNDCKTLNRPDISAAPCGQGQTCTPVRNHYVCSCPAGQQFTQSSRRCESYCGECRAWGDPHYTTYGGNKYDFMGHCKYLLTGICDKDKDGSSPNFDIYAQNKPCGKRGATCTERTDVVLRNIKVKRNGRWVKREFTISFRGADSFYKLNGRKISQTEFKLARVFKATVKKRYLSLRVTAFDFKIIITGSKVTISMPGTFHDKMCGLCGECGVKDKFKLGDGTVITPPKKGRKWDRKAMGDASTSWVVLEEASQKEQCRKVDVSEPECSPELEAANRGNSRCGIFKNENGPLGKCLDAMKDVVEDYYDGCMTDACLEDDPLVAVCDSVKGFAEQCMDKLRGEIVEWRSTEFCPKDCGAKVYSADASCEPVCGAAPNAACNEAAAEGCVCPEGQMRQGEKCVAPDKCGCEIPLENENAEVNWNLPVGESMLMPGCEERVTCVANDDGTSSLEDETVVLSPNAICDEDLPPEIRCARGFKKSEDGKKCEPVAGECREGYIKKNDQCLKAPEEPKNWRQAVYACNKEDGTLVFVDTVDKINAIADILRTRNLDAVYVGGRVELRRVVGRVQIAPVVDAGKQGNIAYANFDVFRPFLKNIYFSESLPENAVVSDKSIVASLVIRLVNDKPRLQVVRGNAPANFICEQKNVEEEDTDWFGPCNTDSDMKDDGDQERMENMIMTPDCLVCPVPMDVKCDAVPGQGDAGRATGTCSNDKDGLLYSCNEGDACIDTQVSTKCAQDVDECTEGLHDCADNAQCINVPGAYFCKCKEENNVMINGVCTPTISCTMNGPDEPTSFVYDVDGFSNQDATFDYDCKFKIASFCSNDNGELPTLTVYDYSVREGGALKPRIGGVISDPASGQTRHWSINPELAASGDIMYGNPESLNPPVRTKISFAALPIRTRFLGVSSSTLVIKHLDNYFSATINMASFPPRVTLQYAQQYAELMCGVCAIQPANGNIVLEAEQISQVSIGNPKCEARIADPPPPSPPSPPELSGPPTPPCEESRVCEILEELCEVPKDSCVQEVCGSTVKVCDYLKKAAVEKCRIGSQLFFFIDSLECSCGDDMEFKYSSRDGQPTCLNPTAVNLATENNKGNLAFMCVCKYGYVLSGEKCIRQENCGCSREDGYRPPGSSWRSDNCAFVSTCEGGNEVKTVPKPCGQNTNCEASERGPECVCDKDMFGNPEAPEGCKPAEEPEEGKRCYDFRHENGTVEKRCECLMGYVHNCENCEDLDECAEGLHDCDLSQQKCVNSPGSFKCECKDGFEKKGDECVDIDECVAKTDNCNAPKGCKNTFGSFECVCCAGYELDEETGSCDASPLFPELKPDSNPPCCLACFPADQCEEALGENPPKYCVEGEEYPNFRIYYQKMCISNVNPSSRNIQRGPCPLPPPVASEAPPSPGAPAPDTPEETPEGSPPGEEGPTPPEDPCDEDSVCDIPPPPPSITDKDAEVCGPGENEDITYPNYCAMVKAVCKLSGGPPSLPKTQSIAAKPGKCEEKTTPPPPTPPEEQPEEPPSGASPPPEERDPTFGPWSDWSECVLNAAADCGPGTRTRNRAVVPEEGNIREVDPSETRASEVCVKPCPPGDISDPSRPPCPDENICASVIREVCGSVGNGPATTFNSECELNAKACNENKEPRKLYEGECKPEDGGDNKRLCGQRGPRQELMKYREERSGLSCVGQDVTIGTCEDQLCQGEKDTCCKGVSYERIQVRVDCTSLETKEKAMEDKHVYYSATKCECQPRTPEVVPQA